MRQKQTMQEFEMTKASKTMRPVAALPPGPTISVEQPRASSQEEPSLAVEYFRMLVRRRWLILPAAAMGAVIGLLITVPQAPRYRAHTSLDVQVLNENFMNMQAVNQRTAPGEETAESFLQTQIKLLESESMIARAMNTVKRQPGTPEMPQDLISILRQRLGLGTPEPKSMDEMVRDVAKSVKVKPMGMTRLVEITCESTSASLSARFCNTLASEFIKNDLEVRSETAQKTGEYLSQQLQDVRKNLESKERLLQSYAQETTLLASGDKEGIAQEKLRQLQAELSQAQADRIVKQSQYELVASATPDSLPPVL
ncbi:MAG: Wzz/FepE/Etk N-terminal domain-containing protein, partial [Bryobacteraceae bacterium]